MNTFFTNTVGNVFMGRHFHLSRKLSGIAEQSFRIPPFLK